MSAECGICHDKLESYNALVTTPRGHVYHRQCLVQLLRSFSCSDNDLYMLQHEVAVSRSARDDARFWHKVTQSEQVSAMQFRCNNAEHYSDLPQLCSQQFVKCAKCRAQNR